MAEIDLYLGGPKSPLNFFRTLKYKILFARNNPDYFYPAGIWVFTGKQGSGKTLSAVQCLLKMAKHYPKAKICSNLYVRGLDPGRLIPFRGYEDLQRTNGTEGIIFFIDELHVLWNSLESKDIPVSEMATFCQMRKDRRVIIGTSQVYNRIAKPIREQLQYIVTCKNFFSLLQVNTVLDPAEAVEKDGRIDCPIISTQWFWHTPELYKAYDTLYKIKRPDRNIKKEVKKRGTVGN